MKCWRIPSVMCSVVGGEVGGRQWAAWVRTAGADSSSQKRRAWRGAGFVTKTAWTVCR